MTGNANAETAKQKSLITFFKVYPRRLALGVVVLVSTLGVTFNLAGTSHSKPSLMIGEEPTLIANVKTDTQPDQNTALSAQPIHVPILIFHHTPSDFEAQLNTLQAKSYTTIDMGQLSAALSGQGNLPAKPVVITFDDGFADQIQAYALLAKYQMKATFYIITSGSLSQWCIGAGRTYTQVKPCGDAYLSWEQIKQLDKSGLITIGAHTTDHLNLAENTPATDRFEILGSKAELESILGHSVTTFAYPYGLYNQNVVDIVREAGFSTAVTTQANLPETAANALTLPRVREVKNLP